MAVDIRKLKDRAAEQMAKRRFDKAAETYAELCQVEPADLTLRQRLADAQRQGGKLREAVVTYQMVADNFARAGLLLKAIAVNKVILELDPTHTATQATLATLYAQRHGKTAQTAPTKVAPPPSPSESVAAVAVERAAEDGAAAKPDLGASALTPIDDLTAAAEAAAAQLDSGLDADDGMEVELAPPDAPGVQPEAQQDEAADLDLEGTDLEAPEAVPGDPLSAFARGASNAPAPELSLDLDAEMEQQIAKAPVAPRRPVAPTPHGPVVPATPMKFPQTPIFSDLDPGAFVELLQRCSLRRFQPTELIVKQGDPGKSFFVISSGTVKVTRTESNGESIDLAHLHEGAFFGEMALVSDGPRSASVFAEGPVELLEFPAEVLTKLMAEHPSARQAVEKFTRNRLLASVMATSPLFRPFDAENRRLLIERFLVRDVAAGETVLEAGKPGDGLYVVMQGRFLVRGRQASGEAVLLSELHEGDIFGEISVLTRSNATADVVAAGPARVLRLPRQVFDEVILTHPQILELVAKLSEERMQTTEAVLGGKVACDTEGLMLL